MQALIFVDSEKELNQLNMIINREVLDFKLYITNSFKELTEAFDNNTIDVIACQINISSCNSSEIFQLARMYNSEIIPVALGYNDCITDFIKVFNQENVFKFIKLPLESMQDLVIPLKEAFDYSRSKNHSKNDTDKFDNINEKIEIEIKKLEELTHKNNLHFSKIDSFYNVLLKQYYQLANQDGSEYIEFFNNTYSNFVYYFYNDYKDFQQSLLNIQSRANIPKENKFFKIKAIDIDEEQDKLEFILYVISFLTDFITIHLPEYKINVIVGKNQEHLLIKYASQLKTGDNIDIEKHMHNPAFMTIFKYLNTITKKTDIHFTDESFEILIVIN